MLDKKPTPETILSDNIICPYCETMQEEHCLINSWEYGHAKVSRFKCRCGKTFNFYKSSKSSWTIPKI